MLIMLFGFIPFKKTPKNQKTNQPNQIPSMPAIWVCFTNKKMDKMCVCMCVFMNSAVLHGNQWKRQLNKKSRPPACFYQTLVSSILVLMSKLESL